MLTGVGAEVIGVCSANRNKPHPNVSRVATPFADPHTGTDFSVASSFDVSPSHC